MKPNAVPKTAPESQNPALLQNRRQVGTLKSINAGLVELPWYVFACLVSAICIVRGKIRLSIFSMVICAYIFSVGYWNQTMSTVAMIVVALPIALVMGAALGLCGLCWWSPSVR